MSPTAPVTPPSLPGEPDRPPRSRAQESPAPLREQLEGRPVGIVGLGLIGGSLGLDLQAAGLEVRALVHREATAERARQRRLASVVSTAASVLEDCGLVVLALPLDRLLDPDPTLLRALPPAAVLTDVGSVKQPVLERWQGLLSQVGQGGQVDLFVASHPMAGTALAGVDAGAAGVFPGPAWGATPGWTPAHGALDPARRPERSLPRSSRSEPWRLRKPMPTFPGCRHLSAPAHDCSADGGGDGGGCCCCCACRRLRDAVAATYSFMSH